MNSSSLQRPRELILSQISRYDIKIPAKMSLLLPRKTRPTLPPIHNQSECRRFKTENEEQLLSNSDIHKLKIALRVNRSQVLTSVSQRLPSLQAMGIIEGGAVRTIRYSGHIRIPTVHNDYHSSKTNAGYSRNKYGGIYPK